MSTGKFFDPSLMKEIRDKFLYVDHDRDGSKWTFLDTTAGGFKLKTLPAIQSLEHSLPGQSFSIPEDPNSKVLNNIIEKGMEDLRIFLNAKDGILYPDMTAAAMLGRLCYTFVEFCEGTNVVATNLDHPAGYDCMMQAARLYNKELRIAKVNPQTGRVPEDEIIRLVDENTGVVEFVHGSNGTGAMLDAEKIIQAVRRISPNALILVDGVQFVPNAPVDLDALKPDAYVFGPYKLTCCRGFGIAYLNDRAARLPHYKIEGMPATQWLMGSKNPAMYAAWSDTMDYLCWLGSQFSSSADRRELVVAAMNAIKDHTTALLDLALNGTDELPGLRQIPHVHIYGDDPNVEDRNFTLTYDIFGVDTAHISKMYYEDTIRVRERHMDGFSETMLKALGAGRAAVRASANHVTSPDEIITFLKSTKRISDSVAG